MTINELVVQAFDTAREKGWHDEERSFPEQIALMHSELSEALEDFRNGHGMAEMWREGDQYDGKPCGIAIELADVVIRIADTCGMYGISLDTALEVKMAYNKTRPYRHGGKKA